MSEHSSDPRINRNSCRVTPILSVLRETPTVKTITFEDKLCSGANPGQYIMLWIPGVDEIPLSLSSITHDKCSVTVRRVGKATETLHRLVTNQVVGIRGPYGEAFKPIVGDALIVTGGTGMAPVMPLIKVLLEMRSGVRLIAGYKDRSESLFYEKAGDLLRRSGSHMFVVTEDGSLGQTGFATDMLLPELDRQCPDIVYTCGPEIMMKKVFDIAERKGIEVQASLERYMKCSIGICGQCVLSPLGIRVCKEGPVFWSDTLRRLDDFGAYKMDGTGTRIRI